MEGREAKTGQRKGRLKERMKGRTVRLSSSKTVTS